MSFLFANVIDYFFIILLTDGFFFWNYITEEYAGKVIVHITFIRAFVMGQRKYRIDMI